jgi:hypothetical protein
MAATTLALLHLKKPVFWSTQVEQIKSLTAPQWWKDISGSRLLGLFDIVRYVLSF